MGAYLKSGSRWHKNRHLPDGRIPPIWPCHEPKCRPCGHFADHRKPVDARIPAPCLRTAGDRHRSAAAIEAGEFERGSGPGSRGPVWSGSHNRCTGIVVYPAGSRKPMYRSPCRFFRYEIFADSSVHIHRTGIPTAGGSSDPVSGAPRMSVRPHGFLLKDFRYSRFCFLILG